MDSYLSRLVNLHTTLGVPADYGLVRGLQVQDEASVLVPLGLDALGRDQFAQAEAARAWTAMREAASNDGIELQIVSVFRSVDYQAALIRRKLEQGQSIDDILRVSAAPGFSEHHTGRAFDISTPGDKVLEESFEATPAYAWLSAQAARFGFTLSYPRNNAQGFNHEPWHWLYQP